MREVKLEGQIYLVRNVCKTSEGLYSCDVYKKPKKQGLRPRHPLNDKRTLDKIARVVLGIN